MLKEKRNQKLRIRMTCFSLKTENDSQQERRKKSCSRRRRRRRRGGVLFRFGSSWFLF